MPLHRQALPRATTGQLPLAPTEGNPSFSNRNPAKTPPVWQGFLFCQAAARSGNFNHPAHDKLPQPSATSHHLLSNITKS